MRVSKDEEIPYFPCCVQTANIFLDILVFQQKQPMDFVVVAGADRNCYPSEDALNLSTQIEGNGKLITYAVHESHKLKIILYPKPDLCSDSIIEQNFWRLL